MDEFAVGDVVTVAEGVVENYGQQFTGRRLQVAAVAYNRDQHPGYDEGLGGQGLYDLADAETGEELPHSLYAYELESAE